MIRKMVFALLALAMFASSSLAGDVYVNGYTRRDGTYVRPHYRSAPDSNPYNNWSSQGNVNPYTGQYGTRSLDTFNSPRTYGSQNPYRSPLLNDD